MGGQNKNLNTLQKYVYVFNIKCVNERCNVEALNECISLSQKKWEKEEKILFDVKFWYFCKLSTDNEILLFVCEK